MSIKVLFINLIKMPKYTPKEDYHLEELYLGDDDTGDENEHYDERKLEKILGLPSLDDVKEWEYLNFSDNRLVDKHAEEILKKLNHKIKKGVTLDFSDNEILGDCLPEFALIIPEEWATINFSNNPIEGLNAAYFIFNWVFSKGVTINLSGAWIKGLWLEMFYEDYKGVIEREKFYWDMPIQINKWAKLNLSNNNIWDKWAEILKDNMELYDLSILDLSNNWISDDMKKELKEWEKSYHDKWINCKVIV